MSRVQLALNVNDIDEAVSFYTTLFGTEPAKRRPGYANFAVTEPPLKLVLLENPGQGGTLNHLGVERDTTCCYARQDKFWVTDAPGGERWEIYTVLADSPTFWGQDDEQRWDAVQAELDGAPARQAPSAAAAPRPPAGAADPCLKIDITPG